MSGYWIPPGLFDLRPWWINPFENGTTIQFIHRWLAKLLVLGVIALAIRARRPETWAAGGMALLQLGLGIATILSGVDIPSPRRTRPARSCCSRPCSSCAIAREGELSTPASAILPG